jgi:hypothetical protein
MAATIQSTRNEYPNAQVVASPVRLTTVPPGAFRIEASRERERVPPHHWLIGASRELRQEIRPDLARAVHNRRFHMDEDEHAC